MEANVHQVEGHSMIAVKYSKDANSNQDSEYLRVDSNYKWRSISEWIKQDVYIFK